MNRESGIHFINDVYKKVSETMYGMDGVIRLCLIALCTDGHVLLEGNPGLGKTSLAKTLANSLGLPWGRIQFTPDLMPSDITGTLMPSFDGASQAIGQVQPGGFKLEFKAGPIFTSVLLADEINRATPKTQAAMLEAMAERQVTVLGETKPLDSFDYIPFRPRPDLVIYPEDQEGRPFLVLATQNPIDYEGTYELPKAQADRFMFKALMPMPPGELLDKIMTKDAGPFSPPQSARPHESAQATRQRFQGQAAVIKQLKSDIRAKAEMPAVRQHIKLIILASNGLLKDPDLELKKQISEFEYGYGPRAATALLLAAKAWVHLFPKKESGGIAIHHPDGEALARVVLPVLRHRTGRRMDREVNQPLDDFLVDFVKNCARRPEMEQAYKPGEWQSMKRAYWQSFENALEDVKRNKLY